MAQMMEKNYLKKLQEKVDEYNTANNEIDGKAIIQWYEQTSEADDIVDTDTEAGEEPKRKKRKRVNPMILAICTPLMARAHKDVCQSSEIVFCDSSSSLDRFNVNNLFSL